jgi:hypothetical protein
MNELRDCIAAAIGGVDDWRGVTDPAILADAVIAALKLHVVTAILADAVIDALKLHVTVGDFQTSIMGSYPKAVGADDE